MVKGETVMPTPGGQISGTNIWKREVPAVTETPAVEEVKEEENDLPELP
jgi:hypothetical protein